ncbi:hypothetical protein BD289DRAFT_286094 [Coniella lustricola]|uniref:Uncharacterized protein n=1 Tax=Coniella lustricola TaxID=2025994 RepID=A0A2T3AKG4_9PEZI|nr:hypothetical protein BD289DRAFT_286094 [Coniella lustricola]
MWSRLTSQEHSKRVLAEKRASNRAVRLLQMPLAAQVPCGRQKRPPLRPPGRCLSRPPASRGSGLEEEYRRAHRIEYLHAALQAYATAKSQLASSPRHVEVGLWCLFRTAFFLCLCRSPAPRECACQTPPVPRRHDASVARHTHTPFLSHGPTRPTKHLSFQSQEAIRKCVCGPGTA